MRSSYRTTKSKSTHHIVWTFSSFFSLTELSPAEDKKTKLNGGGVECIDISSEIEHVRISLSACLIHHMTSNFFKDAEVSVSVGLRQIASGDRVAESEPLGLSAMCFRPKLSGFEDCRVGKAART